LRVQPSTEAFLMTRDTRPLTGIYETKRGHAYRLDGQKADGVTSIIKGGLPAPALTYWAANTVAQYVIDHLDEVTEAVHLHPDTAYYHLKESPWRDRDLAANRGTEVHRYAEMFLTGDESDLEIPDELVGHVEMLAAFLNDWQPTFHQVECVVGNRQYRYMGRFDFLADIPGLGFVLGDWKTSRSGIYPETALQLAAYRHAEFIIDESGAEVPMPEVDCAVAIHVTANNYEVIPLETDESVFRAFLFVQQVHEFAKDGAKSCIGQPLAPTVEASA
ncbi:MAG: hypothetical protein LC750_07655, partial [Actinobacteria bacterium]|nr:hypothetical protein [Actinomycetota bacterium]